MYIYLAYGKTSFTLSREENKESISKRVESHRKFVNKHKGISFITTSSQVIKDYEAEKKRILAEEEKKKKKGDK